MADMHELWPWTDMRVSHKLVVQVNADLAVHRQRRSQILAPLDWLKNLARLPKSTAIVVNHPSVDTAHSAQVADFVQTFEPHHGEP